jgi:hypothetical protein
MSNEEGAIRQGAHHALFVAHHVFKDYAFG